MYFYGVFLLAFSLSFYILLGGGAVKFEYIYTMLPTILALALIVPALTMRSFSEERKNGTEQLLLTSPVSITQIVLGKFIAATLLVILAEVLTLMYFAILCFFGTPHIATTLVTLFGFLLFVMVYVSFGIFASSITENQIIALILSIIFFVITWLLPEFNAGLASISFINLFYKFTLGQVDIANTVTLITFTIMCLLLTIIFMQRRKSVR